ncbi:Acetylornithine/succinyldiaminopimelate aminotransferase [Streptomyces glaucescens]
MTAVPQERRVVTAIPGPKSQELQARRTAAVAAGVGSVLPVFTARAGGGIIEDVYGNRLIDFGSGIAVTSVGASAEAVVRRASAQLADFTHTCFMVTPYEGYVEVAEALAELTRVTTPRSPRCSTPAPRPSRTPSRSPVRTPSARPSSSSTTATTAGRT